MHSDVATHSTKRRQAREAQSSAEVRVLKALAIGARQRQMFAAANGLSDQEAREQLRELKRALRV